MADSVLITGEKTVTVVTVGAQGPAGVSGSSVPATTSTLGGVIVGANLSITGNGVLSANATTNLPWANITGKPTFANVATSGLYSDLTGTPNLSVYLTITSAAGLYQPLGNYVTPACLTYSNITGTPNLSVYLTTANAASTYLPSANFSFANISGKPSTLGGYNITDAYPLTGNPSGFLTVANLTGYLLFSTANATFSVLGHTHAFSSLTAVPNTLAGHNITDGLTSATAASTYALQSTTISNGTGLTGGGSLAASRTLSLANTTVTAGVYGSATLVPVIAVDAQGRITSASTVAVSGGGGLSSVTGSTGITVTGCTTAPVVSIDSTVATLAGTQTLTNKTLASPTISGELFLNSVSLRQAGVLRQSGSGAMTAYEQLTGSVLDISVATDTTFTLNSGTALPAAWNITIIQTGVGKITIVGAGTYSVVGRNGLKTAGQYAVIGIFQTTATGVFVVTGDTIV